MKKFRTTPYLTIMFTFFCVILFGTIMFMLPISTKSPGGLNFVDALFMSTSSVCVTGLSIVSNVGNEFTIFGKIIMAILIEIGGLSFLTIAVFIFVILGVKIGLGNRFLMREALNQNTTKGVVKLVIQIIKITFSIQLIGIFINLIVFTKYYDLPNAIGISIFHSISSFNNAGLDIFGFDTSMIEFGDNILLNINTMFLIISGGLGFIVINDIIRKRIWKKFSLQTKIVLPTTLFLIILGTVVYIISMPNISFLQALFTSVTTRTAGFSTIDMSTLSNPAYCVTIFLMFVGASPCSTGGGLKTTTLFIVLLAIFFYAKGKTPRIFSRSISEQSVFKAFALAVFSVLFCLVSITLISFAEPDFGIKEIVFETVSAFGTVGLSMGITTSLSAFSRIILCLTMFIGRLGPLTIISILNKNWMISSEEEIKFVEEKIMIG